MLKHADLSVRLEAIRTLARLPDPKRFESLTEIAKDESQPLEHRATAIAGLADGPAETVDMLLSFATGSEKSLRDEALRSLVGVKLNAKQRERLESIGERCAGGSAIAYEFSRAKTGCAKPRGLAETAGWSERSRGRGADFLWDQSRHLFAVPSDQRPGHRGGAGPDANRPAAWMPQGLSTNRMAVEDDPPAQRRHGSAVHALDHSHERRQNA